MLKCSYTSITKPKFGNSADENEDNLLEPSQFEIESDIVVKFAIADGATESSFSKQWSDLLVSCYKDGRFDREHIAETILRASLSWQALVNKITLPWYAQQKAETGAFSTLLGLTINKAEHTFETVAIGDCTLFHVRDNKVILTFPVSAVEDFSNSPDLVSTNNDYQKDFEQTVRYAKGFIEPRDLILLATDALAVWIFHEWKAGGKPWDHLQNILTNYKEDFEFWLNNQRLAKEIKNDDVTLITIAFR